MIAFIKRVVEKVMTAIVGVVKKLLTLATLFSFAVLFALFFMYMYRGDVLMCFACLAGIYTFIHLNKVL